MIGLAIYLYKAKRNVTTNAFQSKMTLVKRLAKKSY